MSAWCSPGGGVVLTVVLQALLLEAGPAARGRTELIYRVLSASHCRDVPGLAISSSNSSLRMVGRTKVVFDIDFTVERAAPTVTVLTVNQTRCREIVSKSTCVPGESFAIKKGVCAVLAMPMMPWSEMVNTMQPNLKCPMEKRAVLTQTVQGRYSGRGVGIDMSVAKVTIRPGEDVGTVVVGRGTVFDQDRAPFLCFEVVADLVRVKARN